MNVRKSIEKSRVNFHQRKIHILGHGDYNAILKGMQINQSKLQSVSHGNILVTTRKVYDIIFTTKIVMWRFLRFRMSNIFIPSCRIRRR